MKTDDLIALLATDSAPVPRHASLKRILGALALGTLLSAAVMLLVLGPRADLAEAMRHSAVWKVKVGWALALAGPSLAALRHLARPGFAGATPVAAVGVILALLWLLAGMDLASAPAAERAAMVWGHSWRVCALCIVMVSAPLFVAFVVALRSLAPTRLVATGAYAGLASGSLGTMVYAFHCPETALPFVAIWYVAGIATTTALGALLGPRLLRW